MAVALAALLVTLSVIIGKGRPDPATTEIVVMRHDLTAGSILQPEDLKTIEIQAEAVSASALRTVDSAVGKALLHPLAAGQVVHDNWLRAQPAGIAYPDAAPGCRLYTLRLQAENANGFWLAAGNLVDIHLVSRGSSNVNGDDNFSSMLPEMLPAIKVTAILKKDDNDSNSISAVAGQQADAPLVCLAVSAAEARILAIAEASCLIKLVPVNDPVLDS